jgi:hypothetical protein
MKALNMPYGHDISDTMFDILGAGWWYTWNIGCGEFAGTPQWAMIARQDNLDEFIADPDMLDDCPRPVLLFNEPSNSNCQEGACMTLYETTTGWYTATQILSDTHDIIGPGFYYYGGDPYRLPDVLDEYHIRYGEYPHMDAAAVHYYGQYDADWTIAFNYFRDQYLEYKASIEVRGYDIPIFITEIGWYSGDALSVQAQTAARNWLDAWITFCESDDRCEYLNWFSIVQGTYTNTVPLYDDGELTMVGERWAEEW